MREKYVGKLKPLSVKQAFITQLLVRNDNECEKIYGKVDFEKV